jgi:tetratricopeptide (TPR) repeat protein
LAREGREPRRAGSTQASLAQVLVEIGDYAAALPIARSAVDAFGALGDRRGLAIALLTLGNVHLARDEDDEALAAYREAISIAGELHLRRPESACLNNTAIILRRRGERAEAMRLYERALAVNRELGDVGGQATVFLNMGNLAKDEERRADAGAYYARCIELAVDRFPAEEAQAKRSLGDLLVREGEVAHGLALIREAVELFRVVGAEPALGHALMALGHALADTRDLAGSLSAYAEAADVFAARAIPDHLAKALQGVVSAAIRSHRLDRGVSALDRHLPTVADSEETRLDLYLSRARLSAMRQDGPATILAAEPAAAAAGVTDEAFRARLWRAVGLHLSGDQEGWASLIAEMTDEAVAVGDQRLLHGLVCAVEIAFLAPGPAVDPRPVFDRIWASLEPTGAVRLGALDGAPAWQVRLPDPATLRIRLVDFTESPTTAFLAEVIALRLALSRTEFAEMLGTIGVVFDQLVDVLVVTDADLRSYFPAELHEQVQVTPDSPAAGAWPEQDDPSLRRAWLVVRDDLRDLAAPAGDPTQHRWHGAGLFALRGIAGVVGGRDVDGDQRAIFGFWRSVLAL